MEIDSLQYLLGHFHQDLFEVYGGPDEAIDEFVVRDPHRAVDVPGAIERLLSTDPSEEQLNEFVTRAGCEYDPLQVQHSYRAWLEAVARRIESRLAAQR